MQKDSDPGVRIVRIIAGLLFLQLSRIQRRTDHLPVTTFDDFSIGYVLGFVDVMTERFGIVDQDGAARIFAILAKALFGHETGAFVCARLTDRHDCPEAVRGAWIGRSDSRAWLSDPSVPPLGWYNYCRSALRAAVNRP